MNSIVFSFFFFFLQLQCYKSMLLGKCILLIMFHEAASSEQEHKNCVVSMEAAVPKSMAVQSVYEEPENTAWGRAQWEQACP